MTPPPTDAATARSTTQAAAEWLPIVLGLAVIAFLGSILLPARSSRPIRPRDRIRNR